MKYLQPVGTKPLGEVIKAYTYFADGDVLCAKITPCFENGKLGIASGLANGVGFGSSEFVVMRSGPKLLPEYLYYFLARDEFREAGARVMSGAVGHKRVPKEYFENLPIPLPPLEEQKRIVAVLDQAFAALDRARAHVEANLADARRLFSWALRAQFNSDWQTFGATEIAALSQHVTDGDHQPPPKAETGVPFITISNVDNPLSADYVLSYRDRKLAVIEAKRAGLGHTDGVGQAKDYATRLKARMAYSTNGIGWYGVDMATGREGDHALPFPSPQELWQRCFPEGNDWRDRFGVIPFETGGGKWEPRYYQHNAITAVLEAIARGRERILLTLATGTGKTSIAFQIAWKLFHASWNLGREPTRRPRILFLADRNILADQAYNAFSAFPPDALCRISPDEIRKQGKIPKNASIFFTIFQTFMTGTGEFTFQGYPPDFFDFIVIDECHRGGARDESEWRRILEYFAPAVQLGLTATPKRDANADTYAYFGNPVYTYALKEGINDGFLTPFKVRQMASTLDTYTFSEDDEVVAGEIDPDREYTEADFNTKLVIDERELRRVHEFMGQINQRQKTLVFCATQDHAARVRNFVNQFKDDPDPHYCERVTANDGKLGEQHLREFQDNEKSLPTILTTSQKLSTGVDARNVRNIVLLRPIKSMIEFKQIVGRGTRTFDGKDFFTIYDFVRAYEHFSDPEWDGDPLPPEEPPSPRPPGDPPRQLPEPPTGPEDPPGREKIVVRLADGKERRIRYIAATTYWSHDGRPITGQEFMNQLFGDLGTLVASEEELREVWSDPDRRAAFMQQLADLGYDAERLEDMQRLIDASNSDIFDVLAYVRFTLAPLARRERAERARGSGFSGYEEEMREFLDYVLRGYEAHGTEELAPGKIADLLRIRYGGTNEAKQRLGSVKDIRTAFVDIQTHLYR